MKNKNVLRDYLKYVSLNILGQMAYSCYTLADTFFISANLGADGLTALNLAFPMFCLINGTGLKTYFLACPFIGFNIVMAIFFTSTERPRPAQLISILRGFLILVPVALLLSAILKITGVWSAHPLMECIVALIGMVFYISAKKKKYKNSRKGNRSMRRCISARRSRSGRSA